MLLTHQFDTKVDNKAETITRKDLQLVFRKSEGVRSEFEKFCDQETKLLYLVCAETHTELRVS